MNINTTLLIQVINFGFVWILVRNLLVIPAMQIRMQEEADLEALKLRRDALKNSLGTVADAQYSLWNTWRLSARRSVRENYQPIQVRNPFQVPLCSVQVPENDMKELTHALQTMIVSALKEKI